VKQGVQTFWHSCDCAARRCQVCRRGLPAADQSCVRQQQEILIDSGRACLWEGSAAASNVTTRAALVAGMQSPANCLRPTLMRSQEPCVPDGGRCRGGE
jgi:hypothetical protein